MSEKSFESPLSAFFSPDSSSRTEPMKGGFVHDLFLPVAKLNIRFYWQRILKNYEIDLEIIPANFAAIPTLLGME